MGKSVKKGLIVGFIWFMCGTIFDLDIFSAFFGMFVGIYVGLDV